MQIRSQALPLSSKHSHIDTKPTTRAHKSTCTHVLSTQTSHAHTSFFLGRFWPHQNTTKRKRNFPCPSRSTRMPDFFPFPACQSAPPSPPPRRHANIHLHTLSLPFFLSLLFSNPTHTLSLSLLPCVHMRFSLSQEPMLHLLLPLKLLLFLYQGKTINRLASFIE